MENYKVLTFDYSAKPVAIEVHNLEAKDRETAWEQVDVEIMNTNMQAILLDKPDYERLRQLVIKK